MIDGKTVVCLGGTFNRLHAGHRLLFKTAFDSGDLVFVGIASDSLVKRLRRERAAGVRPFAERAADVKRWLSGYPAERVTVSPLEDPYLPAKRQEFDIIVVSPETRNTAEEINALRGLRGFDDIRIIEVPHLLAFDGTPVSSTRILEGEIDEEGRATARAPAPAAAPAAAPAEEAVPAEASPAVEEVTAAVGQVEPEPVPGPEPPAPPVPEAAAPAPARPKKSKPAPKKAKGAKKPAAKAAKKARPTGKKAAARRAAGRSKARKGSRAGGPRPRR